MDKYISNIHSKKQSQIWLAALACLITLSVSACAGIPANSMTPTPTTVMGVLPPIEQPTEDPTATLIPESTNPAKSADICSMITQAEAEAVLGQTVTSITPGVDTDSISGQPLDFCTYLGKGLAVVISRVDLGSPKAAADAMKQQLAIMVADDASTTSKQQPGPGDQAYWSTNEHAAEFTVLKGSVVFAVLIGGNIGDPEAHKAALKTLAEAVAGRL
jgi:hypothetical protein